jgi:hypothetical protein
MKKKNDPLFNGSPLDTQILHPFDTLLLGASYGAF